MVSFAFAALACFSFCRHSICKSIGGTTMSPESKKLKMMTATNDDGVDVQTKPQTQRSISVPESLSSGDAVVRIKEYTQAMNQRAKDMLPFSDDEVLGIVHSLQNVLPPPEPKSAASVPSLSESTIQWDALRELLSNVAHLSHKDWTITGQNSQPLSTILQLSASNMLSDDAPTRQMLQRILQEGNWDGAAAASAAAAAVDVVHAKSKSAKPWVVLVTVRSRARRGGTSKRSSCRSLQKHCAFIGSQPANLFLRYRA
jgi:hypothetical protein